MSLRATIRARRRRKERSAVAEFIGNAWRDCEIDGSAYIALIELLDREYPR